MSFAELVVFIVIASLVYVLLSPLQKRLQATFYRMLRGQRGRSRETIDINKYEKKENRSGQS